MRALLLRALLLPALLFAAGAVHAADYTAQPESKLGFSATYQDEAFVGSFARFTPVIRFDPAQLATSRFDVRIVLASAGTANAERDEMLLGSEFFDAVGVPEARYVATRFRALGGNRFVAEGTLSLRGVSKPVPLAFNWTPGAKPVLIGEATISRLAFKVGTGDWTDTELLPDAVKVKTRLVLAPRLREASKASGLKARPRQAARNSSSAEASKGQSISAPVSSRRSTGMRSP